MRASLDAPGELPGMVAQQVARMDDIVVHQLGRAGASGAARFAPQLALAPILNRIRDTLAKVYVDKKLAFTLDCPPDLRWRIDEGDAFEMLGNVLDNAAKWARHRCQRGSGLTASACTFVSVTMARVLPTHRRCWQRRVRLDEQVPGHGIGLAVVNDLVASHQGELTLSRSDDLGGARLDIALPAV